MRMYVILSNSAGELDRREATPASVHLVIKALVAETAYFLPGDTISIVEE
jgi:hypothetical protein